MVKKHVVSNKCQLGVSIVKVGRNYYQAISLLPGNKRFKYNISIVALYTYCSLAGRITTKLGMDDFLAQRDPSYLLHQNVSIVEFHLTIYHLIGSHPYHFNNIHCSCF